MIAIPQDKLLKLETRVVKLLREPSTAASVAALAAMFHHHLTNEFIAGLVVVFGTIAGFIGIFLPEGADR